MSHLNLELLADQLAQSQHGLAMRIKRVAGIARHYQWSRIARRGVSVLSRKLAGAKLPASFPGGGLEIREDVSGFRLVAELVALDHTGRSGSQNTDLAAGKLCLLNDCRDLGQPIDWRFQRSAPPPQLWRFQLHYQEYLLAEARRADGNPNWSTIWQLVESWLDAHEPQLVSRRDDAWHPYCISRRLPAWCWLLSMSTPELGLRQRMIESLWRQSDFLSDNLEFDLGGNHLLENLTALTLVAVFLRSKESSRWLKLAARCLRRELRSQTLEHGEHFERSPMYHCQLLGNLLCIAVACRARATEIAELCLDTSRHMIAFISRILHPDGEIPLLGDSGFGEALSARTLRCLSDAAGIVWPSVREGVASVGPYWICRERKSMLLFDAGPVGAPSLPAHAHCDLLAIEASLEGNRWFVDSGNFNYEDDSMRRYCRSSLAHNVATLDDRNQCDVWSKFRMGFRGHPTPLVTGQEGDFDWATAAHDGYRRQGVGLTHRLVAACGEVAWLCVDFIQPRRSVELTGWLHVADDVQIQRIGSTEFALSSGETSRRIRFAADDVELADGWYCPEFGKRVAGQAFRYSCRITTAGPVGWIQFPEDLPLKLFVDSDRLTVRLVSESVLAQSLFEWSPHSHTNTRLTQ